MNTTYKVPTKLVSDGMSNAKTKKNATKTMILYLSPFTQNSQGRNLCPKATAGCAAVCLNTAGRGQMSSVQIARINRTEYFLADRKKFLAQIAKEINNKAKRNDAVVVRLNGTSDVKLVEMLLDNHNVPQNVTFYDYTKIERKAGNRTLPTGHKYVVTYSFSEAKESRSEAKKVLERGGNVAAVFRKELPETFMGFPVVDGDASDIEMLEYQGVILGLKAKGKAKKDTSGFVID